MSNLAQQTSKKVTLPDTHKPFSSTNIRKRKGIVRTCNIKIFLFPHIKISIIDYYSDCILPLVRQMTIDFFASKKHRLFETLIIRFYKRQNMKYWQTLNLLLPGLFLREKWTKLVRLYMKQSLIQQQRQALCHLLYLGAAFGNGGKSRSSIELGQMRSDWGLGDRSIFMIVKAIQKSYYGMFVWRGRNFFQCIGRIFFKGISLNDFFGGQKRSIGDRKIVRLSRYLKQSFLIYTFFYHPPCLLQVYYFLSSLAELAIHNIYNTQVRMFCCMGGGKKEDDEAKSQRRQLSKNKKPEDFMKDVIPLSLSDKIRLTLDKNHKWTCQIADDGRTKKREEGGGLKEKLELMRDKLKSMKREESQLAERTAQDKKRDEEITLQLAKAKAQCQALEWAITNTKLDIRKYKDRVK